MSSINAAKCVLVTGATSGIGRALALAIASLPSAPRVIGVGRRKDRLAALAEANIAPEEFDVNTDHPSLKKFAQKMTEKYPEIDAIIHAAGVQRQFDFTKEIDVQSLYTEMNVNYLSVVSLTSFFLPALLKKAATGHPCLVAIVTSGLAFIPAASIPNYSATKAALHSYTTSLRLQLQDSNVHVTEIAPPLVESELHDAEGTTETLSRIWMPLDQYIRETMDGLKNGDTVVSSGMATETYEKFEKPKEPMIANMWNFSKQHR